MKFIKEIKTKAGLPLAVLASLMGHRLTWWTSLVFEGNETPLTSQKQQNIPFKVKQVTQIKYLYTHARTPV